MNKTTKNILLYGLPLAAGGAFLYWYLRKSKVKKLNTPATTPPNNVNPSKEPNPSVINSNNIYPLKSGSKGPLVVELQTILGGLTLDGKFGPKTQAALLKAYGKTQIDSAADFNNFKAKVQKKSDQNIAAAVAQVIITDYNKNPNAQVYTTLETTMRVIIVNSNGTYTDTGQTITFDKLQLFPRERFVPTNISAKGELRAQYTTAVLPVTFTVLANPQALAVK